MLMNTCECLWITVIPLHCYDTVSQCDIHNESLKYYCKVCGKVVCSDCIVQLHNGHDFCSVQLLGEDFKTKLQSKISYLDSLEKEVTSKVEDVSLVKEEVNESMRHFLSLVDSRFKDIHDLVDKTKEQIQSQLSYIFTRRNEDIAKQLEQLNTEITDLALIRKALEHTLSEVSLINLVSSYDSLTHQCDEIVDTCRKSIKASNALFGGSKPCVEINLPSSKCLQDFFASNCDVYDTSAAPDNCTWSGIPPGGDPFGATIVEVGKEVRLGLMVRNHANQPCSSPQHFKIFLKHGMNEQVELPSRFNEGEYKFSFTPVKQGRSKIHIVLNHVPLPFSPISFTAHLPINTTYHQPTNIIRMSQCPWGITCLPDNVLAVTQAMTVGSIVKITPDTASPIALVQSRISHSELSCPCGITTDDDENLYVSDAGSHLIYKIDPSGNLISGNGNHDLKDPLGLAVMDGRVYVCDSGHDCIAVFSSHNLSFLWKFGKSGNCLGSLSNPTDIATNESSKVVYISDNGNSRIQAFSPDGLVVCSFGEGVLFKPAGIYFDQTRNIMFVTDTKLLCVFVFGCDGNYVTKFGETFISSSPSAITCDKDNYIYVCDHFDKCLYVF